MHIDASIHRICAFARHQGWSAESFGRAAAVPPSTVRDVLRQEGNPTAMTLRAMEAVIPHDFMTDPVALASSGLCAPILGKPRKKRRT
ncbi:hypothetical protein [Azospirillum sp. TSA6c]|uniref:hypothetical protein n=1 Tax=unclassified Azospirillum TaxID=2630922 RepID=UPI000D699BEE|nr:hypothetical protein [Azospirillum sp. TSA6c]